MTAADPTDELRKDCIPDVGEGGHGRVLRTIASAAMAGHTNVVEESLPTSALEQRCLMLALQALQDPRCEPWDLSTQCGACTILACRSQI